MKSLLRKIVCLLLAVERVGNKNKYLRQIKWQCFSWELTTPIQISPVRAFLLVSTFSAYM